MHYRYLRCFSRISSLPLALVATFLTTSLLVIPMAAAQNFSFRQYDEEFQITAADRDLSDFKAHTLKELVQQPFETLDFGQIETGILYDRTKFFSEAGKYTGRGDTTISYDSWKQLYLEMQLSQVSSAELPDLDDLKAAAKEDVQGGTVPIAVMNLEYNKIKETALEDGLITWREGQLYDVSGSSESPYARRVVFAVSAAAEVLRDRTVTFKLDRDFYIDNYSLATPEYFEIDLGDGAGFQRMSFGNRLTTSYASNGMKIARLRAHFPGGKILKGAFTLEVREYSMPTCDLTWGVPGATDISDFAVSDGTYEGEPAYFTACAIFAAGHSSLRKPLIFAEGFDRTGEQDVAYLYNRLGGLAGALSDAGYDLIILNYYDATTHIQRNSLTLTALLRDVNEQKTTREPNVVVGASMGGLVARYALGLMETNDEEHGTTVYVSFDSPHLGANIPLSLQYTILFFSLISDSADEALEDISSPAARQMLVYHYGSSNGEIPKPDQLRWEFDTELNLIDGEVDRRYPRENGIWKVAIANGSGHARAQRDIDGNIMPSGEDALLYAFDKHVLGYDNVVRAYAVPEGGERSLLFYGLHEDFPADHVHMTRHIDAYEPPTSPTSRPYDNAPGGYRATASDIVELSEDKGDARTSWERHAFIPTISALDLFVSNTLFDTGPLFYDIAEDPLLPNKEPLDLEDAPLVYTAFDIIRYAYTNEEHVFLGNVAAFLLEQISYIRPMLTIKDETISAEKPILRSRNETVVTNVTLTADADVILASGGSIRLEAGFEAEKGSRFRAYIDPALSTPIPSTYVMASAKSLSPGSEESRITTVASTKGTGVGEEQPMSGLTVGVPDKFSLMQNFPNPFAHVTTIRFSLPKASTVSLAVYDMLGRRVSQLVDRRMRAGHHSVKLDASHLPSGLYIYRIRAEEWTDIKRMIVVK